MRICHVVPSLEEQYGGPSKSVAALARATSQIGYQVDLLTAHRNTRQTCVDGMLRRRICSRSWPTRLGCSTELRAELEAHEYDIIHNHALWLRPLHYARCRADAIDSPLVVSPRGMMSDWAWHYHSLRKVCARHLIHPGAFEATAGWHATSEEEAHDIRARGFRQPICVAPNGVTVPAAESRAAALAYWREAYPEATRRPVAVFYSRFHRKKRVLELIDLWLAEDRADWLLLIVGLADEYNARQLENYVLRCSGGGRIRVHAGEGNPPPYSVASLFVLPSHSENFGMAVAEAMAHGLPVVVTDTMPWQVVNDRGAGWCVPWTDYPATLRRALGETPEKLSDRGQRACTYVLAEYSWERSARKLAAFYCELQGRHG